MPNISIGYHNWSVSCTDNASNIGNSSVFYFNETPPDLVVAQTNITFNTSQFEEGNNITIFANISNIGTGTATNALVEFFDGNQTTYSQQIGPNQTVTLGPGQNVQVSINSSFGIGIHTIYVYIDRPNQILESDETNNIGNRSLLVPLWQVVDGNISGSFVIEGLTNQSVYKWDADNTTAGNIYVADSDSSIIWTNLTPLGRDTHGVNSSTDFATLDRTLNTSALNDSVNMTFLLPSPGGGLARNTSSIIVFSQQYNATPAINSTNSSNFTTEIFWDSADSSNSTFNGTQDVVFVTQINRQKQGGYGIYDMEIRFPALLRRYISPNTQNTVTFYVELQ